MRRVAALAGLMTLCAAATAWAYPVSIPASSGTDGGRSPGSWSYSWVTADRVVFALVTNQRFGDTGRTPALSPAPSQPAASLGRGAAAPIDGLLPGQATLETGTTVEPIAGHVVPAAGHVVPGCFGGDGRTTSATTRQCTTPWPAFSSDERTLGRAASAITSNAPTATARVGSGSGHTPLAASLWWLPAAAVLACLGLGLVSALGRRGV